MGFSDTIAKYAIVTFYSGAVLCAGYTYGSLKGCSSDGKRIEEQMQPFDQNFREAPQIVPNEESDLELRLKKLEDRLR